MTQTEQEGGASVASPAPGVERPLTSDQRRSALIGLALVLTSAAGYGTQAIFARLAYAAGANVSTVLLLRFVLSLAVLWPVLVTRTKRPGTSALDCG